MRGFEQSKATFLVLCFSPCDRIVGKHLSNAGELIRTNGGTRGEVLVVKSLSFCLILFEGLRIGVGGSPASHHFILSVAFLGLAF